MKRIKSVNGYAIYQSVTKRDEENYKCSVGNYNIYLSSDIRDFGLSYSYPEWEDIDSLSVAEAMCGASQYAVACDLAEEISGSTAQDMDLVLAIEARLDAGEALETVRASFEEALELGHYPDEDLWGDDSDDEDELDDMDLEDQFDALLESGDRADAQHSEPEQDLALFAEAGILSEAMQAAGYAFDEINSTPSFLTFDGDWGTRLWFSNWAEVREWLDGVVFDDDEVSDKVERILHPEHFAALDELNARLAAEQEADLSALTAVVQHSIKLPDDDNWPWRFSEYHSDAAKLRARQQRLFPGCPCESDAHSYLAPGVGELAYVHWFSMMNLWMDCFIVVPAELKDAAHQAADEAMELWFDDDCELGEHELYGDTGVCYGEMIEWVLRDRNIPYAIVFGDEDWDGTDCSDEWNDWAESDWARRESL